MSTSLPVFALDGLGKAFGPVVAVDEVSWSVASGEMFGVIGPDGAGKTTTLRMMCGLLPPDKGTVRLLGVDPRRQRAVATSSIGYVSQRFSLYGDLTIDENIEFFGQLHGVRDIAAPRARLLDLTNLTPFRARLADRLSGGMRQKLALACTLVHRPQVLVLDEPTTGVDPVARREFWKLLAEFLAEGLTIVMATPYLDEAERCGRIALMSDGRVLALDQPSRLQRNSPGAIFEVVVTPVRQALHLLRSQLGESQVQLFGDRLHVRLEDLADDSRLRQALAAEPFRLTSVRRITPTLEDVFIEHLAAGRATDGATASEGTGR